MRPRGDHHTWLTFAGRNTIDSDWDTGKVKAMLIITYEVVTLKLLK